MVGDLVWHFQRNGCLSKHSKDTLPDAACNPLADPLIRGWLGVCALLGHPSKKAMEVLVKRALEIRAQMHERITRCQDLLGCMKPRVSTQALLIF